MIQVCARLVSRKKKASIQNSKWLILCFFLSQEMEKRDFGGPDFKYRVMWRKVLGSGPDWHSDHTREPPFVVNDILNFSAFEIKVQAVNEIGVGPEPDPVIGYSGEDGSEQMNIFDEMMNVFL